MKTIREFHPSRFPRLEDDAVFTLSSHWLLVVFTFVLIGRCDYFGFCYTTLNRKALLYEVYLKMMLLSSVGTPSATSSVSSSAPTSLSSSKPTTVTSSDPTTISSSDSTSNSSSCSSLSSASSSDLEVASAAIGNQIDTVTTETKCKIP